MHQSYWQGKVALITGGSSGLGRAIARALVDRGANVVIAARGQEKLAAAQQELARAGGQVLAIPCDITRQEDVDRLLADVTAQFGRLDALFNNAGRSARGEGSATTPEQFSELMELNLIALVRTTRAALPLLLESRGHLVNIGSLAGKTAARYMGAYSATKFAVSAYSQQLRLELGPRGLHVLLVSPGPIARDEPRPQHAAVDGLPASARKPGAGVKVGLLRPERLADQILRSCERRRPELTVPAKARIVFAISSIWPSLGDWIVRKMT